MKSVECVRKVSAIGTVDPVAGVEGGGSQPVFLRSGCRGPLYRAAKLPNSACAGHSLDAPETPYAFRARRDYVDFR